jgi:hypothetical protein
MKLTHRVLRVVAVVGITAAAPLAAAMPAHAGVGVPQPPAVQAGEAPPWEIAVDPGGGGEQLAWPPGPGATDFLPGPSIIAI